MCLVFGPALPVLYFIGIWGLGFQYFIERMTLTYFFRLPPKHSDKLTLQNIYIMSPLPVITTAFTFWWYTNQQMFDNKIDKKVSKN